MHCPFCSYTVTANPKDYTHANGSITQIKEYTCTCCDFKWLPHHEEMKIHKADTLIRNTVTDIDSRHLYWHD